MFWPHSKWNSGFKTDNVPGKSHWGFLSMQRVRTVLWLISCGRRLTHRITVYTLRRCLPHPIVYGILKLMCNGEDTAQKRKHIAFFSYIVQQIFSERNWRLRIEVQIQKYSVFYRHWLWYTCMCVFSYEKTDAFSSVFRFPLKPVAIQCTSFITLAYLWA